QDLQHRGRFFAASFALGVARLQTGGRGRVFDPPGPARVRGCGHPGDSSVSGGQRRGREVPRGGGGQPRRRWVGRWGISRPEGGGPSPTRSAGFGRRGRGGVTHRGDGRADGRARPRDTAHGELRPVPATRGGRGSGDGPGPGSARLAGGHGFERGGGGGRRALRPVGGLCDARLHRQGSADRRATALPALARAGRHLPRGLGRRDCLHRRGRRPAPQHRPWGLSPHLERRRRQLLRAQAVRS
ncbi:hypothetical protein NGA_2033700, partial [Nannochloropsis gaditana CCMP526]|uniref:uncharacterized protein n=1 Tax=Nannochloropsis gaditana (strain CCMP526) TaxID=1093141 RepID=UPI00029F5586